MKIKDLDGAAIVTRDDVVAASERISGLVERTPLIESEVGGARVWLKCECLQTGGAFKLRGATNRLLQLSAEERERGVVAFSSGNHARGVAIAARRLAIGAVIVMPSDAPQVKVDGTRAEGAEIVFYDRRTESREAIAARISRETGAIVVPSFDDPAIVAGQGTAGVDSGCTICIRSSRDVTHPAFSGPGLAQVVRQAHDCTRQLVAGIKQLIASRCVKERRTPQ